MVRRLFFWRAHRTVMQHALSLINFRGKPKHQPLMKALLICFALTVTTITIFAQATSYGNFKVADQELIYQKVFAQDSITVEKLVAYYKTLPYLSNVEAGGEGVSFDLNDLVVDYKKFQFSQVATPPIIQTGKYSGKGSVGVKDGKYRLTVKSIQMTGDIGYKKIPAKENLTNYACKNNGTFISQDWCKPNTLGLLDKAFTDKLQFVGKGDGDW